MLCRLNLSAQPCVARHQTGHNSGVVHAGLYYAPGSFASTGEVVELAKVAASYGGIYDTHMRDESSYNVGLVGAVEEAIVADPTLGGAVQYATFGGVSAVRQNTSTEGVEAWALFTVQARARLTAT